MSDDLVFTPLAVGPMTVPNRLCETTNTNGAGRTDGLPDPTFCAHHAAKARGGLGWIGGQTWVLPSPLPRGVADELIAGGAATRYAAHQHPDFVPRMRAFVEEVHAAGAVVVAQLTHLNAVFAPSAGRISGAHALVARELTEAQIAATLGAYQDAAAAFAVAGVDGLEVHAAHDALPGMFLSPATNRRTDGWGGDPERRARYLVAALEAVRAGAGAAIAVGARIAAREVRSGGYTRDDAIGIAQAVERAGAHFLDIDTGHGWGTPTYVPPSSAPVALGAADAKAIRAEVSLPVLYAGRVLDTTIARELLSDGACDLVGITRASIADPDLAHKARSGQPTRPCIGCNRCIDNSVAASATAIAGRAARLICSVNPAAGVERQRAKRCTTASTPRRVIVVGAGPAGMQAALTAHERGHDVIVLEARERIGGQVALAARAPSLAQFGRLADYYRDEARRLGIDVRLAHPATVDEVSALAPDVVLCATGSVPIRLGIPELADAPSAHDLLSGHELPHGDVVLISDELERETIAAVEVLAAAGCAITLIHTGAGAGTGLGRYSAGSAAALLETAGVQQVLMTRVTAADDTTLCLRHELTGTTRVHQRDGTSVVVALGTRPNTQLADALCAASLPVQLVGAAWVPRGIHEATSHADRVAMEV